MIIAIPFALPDNLIRLIRQEKQRMLRFHIMFILLCEQDTFFLPCHCRIANQVHFILFPVQFRYINMLFIRTPGDVRQEFLLRCTRFQPDSLSRFQLIDTYRYMMTLHPGHRITARLYFGTTRVDIDNRIFRHHTFIHPVESQGRTFGRPEGSLMNTKFILMNRLSADDAIGRLVRHVSHLILRRKDLQVISFRKCQISVFRAEIIILPFRL